MQCPGASNCLFNIVPPDPYVTSHTPKQQGSGTSAGILDNMPTGFYRKPPCTHEGYAVTLIQNEYFCNNCQRPINYPGNTGTGLHVFEQDLKSHICSHLETYVYTGLRETKTFCKSCEAEVP